MSNYLAIATVTAILQRILQSAVQLDVSGARVTTLQPSSLGGGLTQTGVNLYLYQVSRNPALNNSEGSLMRKGTVSKRQTALDLNYLISVYGNEAELEPQRLLGSVIRVFSDRPNVIPEMIQETLADSSFAFLAQSNLADQFMQLRIMPNDLSLDDLSKVWTTFFQTPYALSMSYRVTTVMIDGEETNQQALPIRDRSFGGIVPFPSQPVIDQAVSETGWFDPLVAESTLVVRGKHLQSQSVAIRIGDAEAAPIDMNETQIKLPLLNLIHDLRPGVQHLQVLHRIASGTGTTSTVGSNTVPIVIRPVIKSCRWISSNQWDDLKSGEIEVESNLAIAPRQRVVLVLNEWTVENPAAYLFEATSRTETTPLIRIPIRSVKPGTYLVRLQVDGAESPLSIETDSQSPTANWYNSPKITIG